MTGSLRGLTAAALLSAGCAGHIVRPSMDPREIHQVTTADGWRLDLRRYPSDGPPVLLVHGMSANHYNWDFRPEISLADYLQSHGFDVWVPELRGDQGALPPAGVAHPRRYTFDDHANLDVPAIVRGVLDATGAETVQWVGHSMGGMLLYTQLTRAPEQIRAGVAICSPGTFEHPIPIHDLARSARWMVTNRSRIPSRAIGKLIAPFGKVNVLVPQVANPALMDGAMLRGLSAYTLEDVPGPVAHQAMGWLTSGAFTRVDGSQWLEPRSTPLLLMGAARDGVVSEADVAATCARYPNCEYLRLGREQGFSDDYGHVDPVLGRTARDEVYPHVLEFLQRTAAPSSGSTGTEREQ